MLLFLLLVVQEVWDVEKTYWKSVAGIYSMFSDLIFGPFLRSNEDSQRRKFIQLTYWVLQRFGM